MDPVLENFAHELKKKETLSLFYTKHLPASEWAATASQTADLSLQTPQGARTAKRQFEGRRGDKGLQCHQTGM